MDPPLWDSIPANRRKKYPGKHDTYIFGQGSADGTACIGCAWQTYSLLVGAEAVDNHDDARGFPHHCEEWIIRNGICPCGLDWNEEGV